MRTLAVLAMLAVLTAGLSRAAAQSPFDVPTSRGPTPSLAPVMAPPAMPVIDPTRALNPLEVMDTAASVLPQAMGNAAGEAIGDRPKGGLSAAMNVMLLLTVITLAPAILLMCTCFVRILVVLALLRQALGTQTLPPPQVTMALALFTTAMVMTPTIDRIHAEAIVPYRQGEISTYQELWDRGKQPIRDFMFAQIEATGNWSSLYMMLNYRGVDTSRPELLQRSDVDMLALIPAFMLSELKTAFLIGFKIYLPFLVIDMVISTMLISMSMMMLPPVLISLPFKLLLFVLVDGWQLIVGSLMNGFVQPGPARAMAELAMVVT